MKTKLLTLKRKLVNNMYRCLYNVYYHTAFGRRVPFGRKLTEIISSWEQHKKKGDIPVSQEVWESQYLTGRWNYMSHFHEVGRYSTIVGYIQYLKRGGSILDVGCGEGILLERLCPSWYSKYLGIDISQEAIDKASKQQTYKSSFIRDDAEKYVPTELFDVIIFNETLYYFIDPLSTVLKYTKALKEDGIIIISTYVVSKRAKSILNRLKSTHSLFDETMTTQRSNSWICSVFVPNV